MAGVVGMSLEGMDAFMAAVDKIVDAANEGGRRGANNAAQLVASRTKSKLTWTTHKKGEPTESQPGEPPALVTGTLRRSVKVVPAVPLGAGAWQAQVGPTAVYARIQELGGRLGANPRHGMWRSPATLPPRPYLAPSVAELVSGGQLWAAFREGWGA